MFLIPANGTPCMNRKREREIDRAASECSIGCGKLEVEEKSWKCGCGSEKNSGYKP